MKPYEWTRLSVEEMTERARSFREEMAGRRSVRDFSDEPAVGCPVPTRGGKRKPFPASGG